MRLGRFALVLLPALLIGNTSCRKAQDKPMTVAEAQQALEESTISGEAATVTSNSIEITTNFTIGQAVEAAAQEIQNFVTSQLPCAEVTLANATLTIEYGVKAGNCTYNGHTFSGSHSVTVEKNDSSDVVVHHQWTDMSNGKVSVSGTADVTWSLSNKSRHIVHELTWTRLSDGRTGVGTGDRTQTVLPGGLVEGIRIDGSRSWTGQAGRWDLAIEGVEIRWSDPVPQAGTYRLATPKDRSIAMSFARVDQDTIRVTVSSGTKSFSFNVSKAGGVSQS